MLNEPKIKEKIANAIDKIFVAHTKSLSAHYLEQTRQRSLDEIYRLFLPALDALDHIYENIEEDGEWIETTLKTVLDKLNGD